MELSVRESASLLNVSEKTIYRWIKQGVLPAYRVHDQYRFNRAELLGWATARRLPVSFDIFTGPQQTTPAAPLTDAISAGGIHYGVGGADRSAALRCVVELMPLPPDADREFVLHVFLTRESLGSTAIGNGIALPHARNPMVMSVPHPMITLCFLDQAIEYEALTGNRSTRSSRCSALLFARICRCWRGCPMLCVNRRLPVSSRGGARARRF